MLWRHMVTYMWSRTYACDLQALGLIQECIVSYEQAVDVYRDVVGDDHLSTAAALANLGLAFKAAASGEVGMERVKLLAN